MIYIQPLGNISLSLLGYVSEVVNSIFDKDTKILSSIVVPRSAFIKDRNQYDIIQLLTDLGSKLGNMDGNVIAITDVDLCVHIFDYVFGGADDRKEIAVISIVRLDNSFYGLRENTDLMLERIKKEVIHELGHTYFLGHCDSKLCVMYKSACITDTDFKGSDFCKCCYNKINFE